MDDTFIVLTSDHGDFLGDHWLGEKQFFHDTSIRVPLIVYDPSPEADATRGTVSDALVECIDFAPTFVEVAGGSVEDHWLEGHSLLPVLRGQAAEMPREAVFCEYDYSATPLANRMKLDTTEALLFMVADKRWKLVHAEGGFRPILFDMQSDPQELTDLGDSPEHAEVIAQMYDRLNRWLKRPAQRVTESRAALTALRSQTGRQGVLIGVYDEAALPEELTAAYRGRRARDHRSICPDRMAGE
jgi:arylsulfatase A-like enzyme